MSARTSFDYAVLRVVPDLEREEFVNAGIVMLCLERGFLGARVHLDETRVRALAPDADVERIAEHLQAIVRVADGGDDSGPIGRLSVRERFHWLVAPRSTVIQVSAVHVGLCESPDAALAHLMARIVLPRPPYSEGTPTPS